MPNVVRGAGPVSVPLRAGAPPTAPRSPQQEARIRVRAANAGPRRHDKTGQKLSVGSRDRRALRNMNMHGGNPMKRQRGRGRKPGGGGGHHSHHNNNGGNHYNQPNRTLESNGPDMKVRGPAAHIYERYLQLARDASSSGDRVLGENYLQHADHYFRLLRAMQPATPPPPAGDRYGGESDFEGDDEGGPEGENVEAEAGPRASTGGDQQPEADFQAGQQSQPNDRDGESRRRRGRRSRFRQDGQAEGTEGRDSTQENRSQETRDRAPRGDDQREESGPEGFSSGPKPAFLRSE